jgi:hypothetical protein
VHKPVEPIRKHPEPIAAPVPVAKPAPVPSKKHDVDAVVDPYATGSGGSP